MSYVKTMLGVSRKCIVLDLDNTLWGGIVGEDGFDGIELAQTAFIFMAAGNNIGY